MTNQSGKLFLPQTRNGAIIAILFLLSQIIGATPERGAALRHVVAVMIGGFTFLRLALWPNGIVARTMFGAALVGIVIAMYPRFGLGQSVSESFSTSLLFGFASGYVARGIWNERE